MLEDLLIQTKRFFFLVLSYFESWPASHFIQPTWHPTSRFVVFDIIRKVSRESNGFALLADDPSLLGVSAKRVARIFSFSLLRSKFCAVGQ